MAKRRKITLSQARDKYINQCVFFLERNTRAPLSGTVYDVYMTGSIVMVKIRDVPGRATTNYSVDISMVSKQEGMVV